MSKLITKFGSEREKVRSYRQKISKWQGQVSERLQTLSRRAGLYFHFHLFLIFVVIFNCRLKGKVLANFILFFFRSLLLLQIQVQVGHPLTRYGLI